MSGTAKTQAALLAEQPNNTSGSILPQQMRNLTVSGPQWDVVSSAAAPGILRGTVELTDYVTRNGGALGSGQTLVVRQANAAQVQNAFNYAATNGKFLQFSPGTIEIDNTTGILIQSSIFDNFRLYGQKGGSILAQFHTGAPVLTIGPTDGTSIQCVVVDGLYLQYAGALATGNTVLEIGYIFFSKVSNIQCYSAFNADYLVRGQDGGVGSAPFSNIFENFNSNSCNGSFLYWDVRSTGCVWSNIYFENTDHALSAPAIYIGPNANGPTEMTFMQLNVEHVKTNVCMFCNGGSATFIDCHWEDVEPTGDNPQFWAIAGGSSTNIKIIGGTTSDLGLYSGNITTGPLTYFAYFDDAMISMDNHRFETFGSPTLPRDTQMTMLGDATGAGLMHTSCKIDNTRFDFGFHGFVSLDSSLPRATYGDVGLVDGYLGTSVFPRIQGRVVIEDPPNNAIIYGALGSDIIVRYINPIAANRSLTLATLLISGGTLNRPALDQIRVIRESSCTGAFTITVKNAAGGTIGSAFTTTSAGTSKIYVHTTTAGTWTQTV